MPQSISQIWLHIVFSTQNRFPFLRNDDLRSEMHTYLAGVCRNLGCPSRIVGGTQDHVHILCTLSRSLTVSNLLRKIKEPSSKWVKTKGGMLRKFHWQNGYAAFSVSASKVDAVERYIASQQEHHRRVGFQEELLQFLDEYEVDYDERYLWE